MRMIYSDMTRSFTRCYVERRRVGEGKKWRGRRYSVPAGSSGTFVLDYLMHAQVTVVDVESWWDNYLNVAGLFENSVDKALVSGFHSDRIGYAFASGYQAGVHLMASSAGLDVEREGKGVKMALCDTEAPEGCFETVLKENKGEMLVNGAKNFVMLGNDLDWLLVHVREEDRKGTKVAVIEKKARGVKILPMESTLPFIPEIPNGQLILQDAPVQTVLPGDGYSEYIQPFRTIEDIHVHASIMGYLFRIGREFQWPKEKLELILAHLVSIRAISFFQPTNPSVHIALSGILKRGNQLLEELKPHWELVNPQVRETWNRDIKVMIVAQISRDQRTKSAWERFGSSLKD